MKRHLVFFLLLIPLSVILLVIAITSLQWRMAHDAPTEIYVAFLMDRFGLVPYRDLWEVNLPGSLFAYMVIGRLIGYTNDLSFRLVDLAYLTALGSLSAGWLRHFGWKTAWSAPVLFGLVYLQAGPAQSLQREYLMLLPAMLSLLVATRVPRLNNHIRAVLVGLIFGLAATVKPHFAIGFPGVLLGGYLAIRSRYETDPLSFYQWLSLLIVAGAAFALPLAATVVYMAISGGLPHYLDVLINYYPLYANVTKDLQILKGSEHTSYLFRTFLTFGGFGVWLVPAAIGLIAALSHPGTDIGKKRELVVLASLVLAYCIYPMLSGQFFIYHMLPFLFFLFMLVALCFVEQTRPVGSFRYWGLQIIFALALFIHVDFVPDMAAQLVDQIFNQRPAASSVSSRVDEIAQYLKEHLEPGDTVQPLDWVAGGVLQGLLEAQARIATPYLTDMQFFHDVSTPYIQGLRKDFLSRLAAMPPRYIVEYKQYPWIGGPDTTSEFLELWLWIDTHYQSVYLGDKIEIYQRIEPYRSSGRRLVLMYPPPVNIASWYPNVTNITILPVGDAQLSSEELLDTATKGYPYVTVAFANEAKRDPHQEMETWASQHLFRSGEHWGYGIRMVDYVVGTQKCLDIRPQKVVFGDRIVLNASSNVLTNSEDGQWVYIQLSWVADDPVHQSYKIAAHVVDENGNLIAQYDSQPVGYLAPTTAWVPGEAVIDRFAILLPEGLPPGDYETRVVVYDETTQVRLSIAGAEPPIDYVSIGKIVIQKNNGDQVKPGK